jgi:hypothetical protein
VNENDRNENDLVAFDMIDLCVNFPVSKSLSKLAIMPSILILLAKTRGLVRCRLPPSRGHPT